MLLASLIDKFLKDYNPDISKIKKVIINLLLFVLRYIFPLYLIIDLYLKTILIDKLFVMKFVLLTLVFVFNIIIDIFNYYFNRILGIIEKHLELIKSIVQLIKDSYDLTSQEKTNNLKILPEYEKQLQNIEELLNKQLKINVKQFNIFVYLNFII